MIERRVIPHTIRRRAIPHATNSMDAIRRRVLPHATGSTGRDPATDDSARDEPHRTRRTIPHTIRHQTIRHATTLSSPTMGRRPGGAAARCPYLVLLCPVMPGDTRLCSLMLSYVSTAGSLRLRVCSARCIGMRAAQRWASPAPLAVL